LLIVICLLIALCRDAADASHACPYYATSSASSHSHSHSNLWWIRHLLFPPVRPHQPLTIMSSVTRVPEGPSLNAGRPIKVLPQLSHRHAKGQLPKHIRKRLGIKKESADEREVRRVEKSWKKARTKGAREELDKMLGIDHQSKQVGPPWHGHWACLVTPFHQW
jgi:hypothetical protein